METRRKRSQSFTEPTTTPKKPRTRNEIALGEKKEDPELGNKHF
jgi:hypothetical protein